MQPAKLGVSSATTPVAYRDTKNAFHPLATEEQIAALEQLGLEICIRSGAAEELWLVPSHKEAGRNEMTFREACTLARICAVFPNVSVTGFRRREESRE